MDNNNPHNQNNFPPYDNPQVFNGQLPPSVPQPSIGQPMNQPLMSQPMPMQPATKSPKRPMDPAKKRKLIFGLLVGGVALALCIAAVIIVPILLKIDYSSTYAVAKELKPKIDDIYYSYDCEYVVDRVKSTYFSDKEYAEFVENCKNLYSGSIDELVDKLENTDGVKRNNEIATQFKKFKSEYVQISSGSEENLSNKLALWQATHDYNYALDNLNYSSSSDAEITAAANILIDSGNDTLKTYGEGWLERTLIVATAYRTYRSNYNMEAYKDYSNKSSELSSWIAANKPSLETIAPLDFKDATEMYSEFNKLYNLISETYEQNYNTGSGDCDEFLGEVYCE